MTSKQLAHEGSVSKNPMTLIGEWEENRYHDSYFHGLFWDPQQCKLVTKMIGATAFAGGVNYGELTPFTESSLETLREFLRSRAIRNAKDDAHQAVFSPDPRRIKDQPIRLTDSVDRYPKVADHCRRCSSTGFWQNPENKNDRRPCFACRGRKHHGWKREKGSKRKKLQAGLRLTVVDCRNTSRYTNGLTGLGTPMLEAWEVLAMGSDGKVWGVPANKIRLDRDPTPVDPDIIHTCLHQPIHPRVGKTFARLAVEYANTL